MNRSIGSETMALETLCTHPSTEVTIVPTLLKKPANVVAFSPIKTEFLLSIYLTRSLRPSRDHKLDNKRKYRQSEEQRQQPIGINESPQICHKCKDPIYDSHEIVHYQPPTFLKRAFRILANINMKKARIQIAKIPTRKS